MTVLYASRPAYVHFFFADTNKLNNTSELIKCNSSLKGFKNIILNYTLDFLDKGNSRIEFDKEAIINYTGSLYTLVLFCGEHSTSAQNPFLAIQGTIYYSHSFGFLSASYYITLSVHLLLAGLSLLLLVLFGFWFHCNQVFSETLQKCFFGLLVTFTIEMHILLLGTYLHNMYGDRNQYLSVFHFTLSSLRVSFAFLFMLYWSNGGFYKLSSEITIPEIPKLITILFFFTYIMYLLLCNAGELVKTIGSIFIVILVILLLIESILLFYWIISKFGSTYNMLQDLKQEKTAKITMIMRNLTIIILTVVLLGCVLEVIRAFKTTEFGYKDSQWKEELYWQIVSFLLFAIVGAIIRKYTNDEITAGYNENIGDSSQASRIGKNDIVVDISDLYKDEEDIGI